MSTPLRVIARFADGRLTKGTTQDFDPHRPRFHVLPADGTPPVEVRFNELKAVFFVKTLEGNPHHKRLRGFPEGPPAAGLGKKVAVLFKDGELLCGHALSYSPDRDGFFLSPADTEGNTIRLYVVTAATGDVRVGPAAEQLAARILGGSSKNQAP
jgi:hypothetical protein